MEGNVQKMREALEKLNAEIGRFYNNGWIPYDAWQGCDDMISRTLSLPLKNCDVGTADEQAQRYDKFCEGMDCVKCPVHALWHHYFEICKNRKVSCGLIWAQMPYEGEEK